MITAWDIYWITRLDGVGFLCAAILIVGGIVSCFIWLPAADNGWDSSEGKIVKRIYKIIGISVAIALIIGTITPSTKEAVAIYMIPKIVNNEQVQKLPDNAMKFLNEKFEGWLNDMAGKKKDK